MPAYEPRIDALLFTTADGVIVLRCNLCLSIITEGPSLPLWESAEGFNNHVCSNDVMPNVRAVQRLLAHGGPAANAAAEMLLAHDETGIDLDRWEPVKAFVQDQLRAVGMPAWKVQPHTYRSSVAAD